MEINGQNLEATVDPNITATINRQTGMTNAGLASQYNSGNNEARGLLSGGSNYNSGLNYGSSAESDAIRGRYMPQYNLQEKQLNLDNVKAAQTDHLRNLQVATQAASEEVQVNKQKALLKWQMEQNNKKARGAVLGNVLGIVGAVGGAIVGGVATMGGGAAPGAAAGYALGQGAGNAIGSS